MLLAVRTGDKLILSDGRARKPGVEEAAAPGESELAAAAAADPVSKGLLLLMLGTRECPAAAAGVAPPAGDRCASPPGMSTSGLLMTEVLRR